MAITSATVSSLSEGCTTALFITDPVTLEDVRSTDDIYLIVNLAGLHEWAMLLEDLRTRGFVEAADDDVICRMRLGRLKVGFMPDDEAILGFCNRWYANGIETAQPHILDAGLDIKVLTPPIFVATKLEDVKTVIAQLPLWFEHYNTLHPHKALGYRSPREFLDLQTEI